MPQIPLLVQRNLIKTPIYLPITLTQPTSKNKKCKASPLITEAPHSYYITSTHVKTKGMELLSGN